jgi:hypothetical protein
MPARRKSREFQGKAGRFYDVHAQPQAGRQPNCRGRILGYVRLVKRNLDHPATPAPFQMFFLNVSGSLPGPTNSGDCDTS